MKKAILPMFFLLAGAAVLCGQRITVTSPAAGNTWAIGGTYSIIWTKSGTMPATVMVRLRRAGAPESEPSVLFISQSTANDGSLSWTIPATVPADDYFIRVNTTSPMVTGDSGTFAIAPTLPPPPPQSAIQILKPSRGSLWTLKEPWEITWKSTGKIGPVRITLLQNGRPYLEIAANEADDGLYLWTIPGNIPEGKYAIMINAVGQLIFNISGLFTIVPPQPTTPADPFQNRGPFRLAIDAPANEQVLHLQDTFDIGWQINAFPAGTLVDLLLYCKRDFIGTIAQNVPAGNRTFSWRVGNLRERPNAQLIGSGFRVVVRTADNANSGTSYSPFNIVNWTLEVTSPGAGAEWFAGSVRTIAWRSSGTSIRVDASMSDVLRNVRILLGRRGFGIVGYIANSTPNTGSFQWTVGTAVNAYGRPVDVPRGPYFVIIYIGPDMPLVGSGGSVNTESHNSIIELSEEFNIWPF